MKLARLLVLLLVPLLARAADRADYLVADSGRARPGGVRVTYLGTNGYLLEAGRTTVLVDPYFTRLPLKTVLLNRRVTSSAERVEAALRRLPRKVDAVLVTHGHFDHLLDVPPIARRTGAKVLASRTAIFLATAAELPSRQGIAMSYGQTQPVGAAKITALRASHDRILGCCVPFPGTLDRPREDAPNRAGEWVCGEPLAFLIEMGGRRIYVDSGGTRAVLPEGVGPVDLAILGVALPDARKRLPHALADLRPRYFLPSHQDDFFRPLEQGFVFGKMTDFHSVVATAKRARLRLIMLDYFRPWTLR